MKFCQAHWDTLRSEIDKRGLSSLIAKSGTEAAERMQQEVEKKETDDTYDPLMAAHWAIVNNAMEFCKAAGANPLTMMCEDAEHPEHQCPICFLNWLSAEHDRTCTNPDCKKPRGQTVDWMIERAANDALDYCKEHSLVTTGLPPSRQ